MTDPCQFQPEILKHSADIAKQGQAIEGMAADMKKVADAVEIIAEKLSSMRGFVAGAAAAGGALVGLVVWLSSKLPAIAAAIVK